MRLFWLSGFARGLNRTKQTSTWTFGCARRFASMTADSGTAVGEKNGVEAPVPKKLHGRAFYESIGSPKFIVAPMVDQSEFAWRMLTRSYFPDDKKPELLAYTPMLHSRLFMEDEKYRQRSFQAIRPETSDLWLDGNPTIDRPLFVQFCANDPDTLLAAAQHVTPYCDAVDLNLGCPQGIARKGHYGAFLQEDPDLIFRIINKLHLNLSVPVTAKIRILETKEATLKYAQKVLEAGASILTVHGRRREQKGHLTGVADWQMLRFLRDSLPPETVLFANGNVLQEGDLQACLDATGADGVMSAEGNLSDPGLFVEPPPVGQEGREYWRGKDGRAGWRVDGIMRRYLDILYKYALDQEPPQRRPLFMPGDDTSWLAEEIKEPEPPTGEEAQKKIKTENKRYTSPNMSATQPHLFHLLRHLVSVHTNVRDMLARSRRHGFHGFEVVLSAVEKKVAEGLLEYERTGGKSFEEELEKLESGMKKDGETVPEAESSLGTRRRCKQPFWVAQPIIRPLPAEAMAKGAIQPRAKELKKDAKTNKQSQKNNKRKDREGFSVADIEKKRKMEEKSGSEAREEAERSKEIKSRDDLVAG